MAVRTVRDWRGIKLHLSDCSTEELINLATNAQHTRDHIDRFLESIDAELARRRSTAMICVG